MGTEFNFPNSRSLINFLMLFPQDLKDIIDLDIMDSDLMDLDLMDLDLMEKEEVEKVVHSRVNLTSMMKWMNKKLNKSVSLKREQK